ncbi:response regulator [Amycolatopsis sp. NPDC004368]
MFADIAMPDLSGIAMSRMIAAIDLVPTLVLVTAYADNAVDAFDLGAVDHLLKPYRQSRLDRTVERVIARRNADRPELTDFGRDLAEPLDMLAGWARHHMKQVTAARAAFDAEQHRRRFEVQVAGRQLLPVDTGPRQKREDLSD